MYPLSSCRLEFDDIGEISSVSCAPNGKYFAVRSPTQIGIICAKTLVRVCITDITPTARTKHSEDSSFSSGCAEVVWRGDSRRLGLLSSPSEVALLCFDAPSQQDVGQDMEDRRPTDAASFFSSPPSVKEILHSNQNCEIDVNMS